MCASPVLRGLLSTLHTYRGSLPRPLQRLLCFYANLWDCHLTPKRGRLKGLYLLMMFLVLNDNPNRVLTVLLSFRGNVVDVSFYCDGCSLVIFWRRWPFSLLLVSLRLLFLGHRTIKRGSILEGCGKSLVLAQTYMHRHSHPIIPWERAFSCSVGAFCVSPELPV